MYQLIRKLFTLITPAQKKQYFRLQLLLVLMALVELIGIGSIAPFMAIIGDMTILQNENVIASIYHASGIDSEQQFVFFLGFGVLVMLVTSAFISMLATWRMSMFATRIGVELSHRLYEYYLHQDWIFHVSGSSAQHMRKIANEATRLTDSVLTPLMVMNARIVSVFFISTAIFIYDPVVAVTGTILFVLAYMTLYKFVRRRLYKNGLLISKMYEKRFQLMNEGFGGIKELLLLGRAPSLIDQFEEAGNVLARSQGVNQSLLQVPRYLMELVAFGVMIALVLYLIAIHDNNLGFILPVISVYGMAGFKLLPALQQIYYSLAEIKSGLPAFEAIVSELEGSIVSSNAFNKKYSGKGIQHHITPLSMIQLEGIHFTYPGKIQPAVRNLDMAIDAGSVVGIVGASGSGKSTTIDILLGLIQAQRGRLIVDEKPITKDNMRAWQSTIGLVPQVIFLAEGSIAENVAFGIPSEAIDFAQVKKSLEMAHLGELLSELPDGIHTRVGDRGIRLSGGQRQRIAIARALYHHADVLVFDEATSALDGVTEKMIMDAIHDFSGDKTIIMIAHRLKTVEHCQTIYVMDKGTIIAQGTFNELMQSCQYFRDLASFA
jgi:HlyD family secretion protein